MSTGAKKQALGLGVLLAIAVWTPFCILISDGAAWGGLLWITPWALPIVVYVMANLFTSPYDDLTKEQRDWMREWSDGR